MLLFSLCICICIGVLMVLGFDLEYPGISNGVMITIYGIMDFI